MSVNKNIKLDINFVKSQFPAFEDPLCKEWSFFENAGGSYVPKQVIDKLNKFMISINMIFIHILLSFIVFLKCCKDQILLSY